MSLPSTERKPLTDTLQERLDHIDRYFATVSDEDFLRHLKEAGFTLTPTHHCTHLHRAVTQRECSLCWIRREADATHYGGREWSEFALDLIGPKVGQDTSGWDTCRAKHITPEEASR